jgi:benzodiazapine receptor
MLCLISEKMDLIKLIFSILIIQLSGGIGAMLTFTSLNDWYSSLSKPVFTPPNWIFAPVWTFLYTLIGVSFYLVWQKGLKNSEVKKGLRIFTYQLVLNILWSAFFFGLRSPILGLIDILIMNYLIYLTIVKFRKIMPLASYLLYPYFAWVLFATVLNISIVILN